MYVNPNTKATGTLYPKEIIWAAGTLNSPKGRYSIQALCPWTRGFGLIFIVSAPDALWGWPRSAPEVLEDPCGGRYPSDRSEPVSEPISNHLTLHQALTKE